MSKKYHDGFYQVCNTMLESHANVSVRGLASFLEIPRSVLREGLKRVTDSIPDNNEELEDVVSKLIGFYFNEENKTISEYYDDSSLQTIYGIQYTEHNGNKSKTTSENEDNVEYDEELLTEKSLSLKVKSENRKADGESISDYAARLARQKQKAQDVSRVERTLFRNYNRAHSTLEELNESVHNLLHDRKDFFPERKNAKPNGSQKVGVIQLSDIHFGELVKETVNNRFDIDIASKRLMKLIARSKAIFKADGITNVAVLMTGDMINSTRRISEITAYADARVKVVFNAYLILGSLLEDLYQDFDVTVGYVVGNESRLSEFFDSTNFLASDNFDLMLYMMLKNTHEKNNLAFLDNPDNPMEQVIDINGSNFLLVHGNGHRGLANTSKIETEVEKIKSRYSSNGVNVHYVVCGHIHSTYISNSYARSASIVGSNAYAERTLNCTSKASQNVFVVDYDGSIDGFMIDLQTYEGYEGYEYDHESIEYNSNDDRGGTVLIQKVLI